jgi:hypothetical protein
MQRITRLLESPILLGGWSADGFGDLQYWNDRYAQFAGDFEWYVTTDLSCLNRFNFLMIAIFHHLVIRAGMRIITRTVQKYSSASRGRRVSSVLNSAPCPC